MVPVLEAVPNFSEGRDPTWVRSLVERVSATGVDVLDWSMDADHHRSVLTFVGDPRTVEVASLEAARHALDHIDLRTHEGVHPRVGAMDVLPLVPLRGLDLTDAARSAHRIGEALSALGLPVYFYGAAAQTRRRLAELRRGGFEAFRAGYPPGREPDILPCGRLGPHPTAGVVCVGAREILLAWNVYVEDLSMEILHEVAAGLRERNGGFRSLRTLALDLPRRGRRQISMNLEDLAGTPPLAVFQTLERSVRDLGGRVTGTEVIGMIPDGLVLSAAEDRLQLLDAGVSRLLSVRVAEHVAARVSRDARGLLDALAREGEAIPPDVKAAAERLSGSLGEQTPIPSSKS